MTNEMEIDEAVARHEAAHATVARLLNIEILHATAGEDAHVRTKYQNRDLEKIVQVDLAGLAVDSSPWAIEQDLRNAMQHAERAVLLRHGTDKITPGLRAEVTTLLDHSRATASRLVVEHKPAIDRVAAALVMGDLDQTGVDAAIATDELTDETRALALLQALGDFVESLQDISEAKGRDDPDDFERAANAVINMQRTAMNCLRRHGFEPRGTLVE